MRYLFVIIFVLFYFVCILVSENSFQRAVSVFVLFGFLSVLVEIKKNKMNNLEKFTVEEFKNYVHSQQSMGDVCYYLSAENIKKANNFPEINPEANAWWKEFTLSEKLNIIKEWKTMTHSKAQHWDESDIIKDEQVISLIYNEYELQL